MKKLIIITTIVLLASIISTLCFTAALGNDFIAFASGNNMSIEEAFDRLEDDFEDRFDAPDNDDLDEPDFDDDYDMYDYD